MESIKKFITGDFLSGKKTFIVGWLMILHGGSKVVLDFLGGGMPSDMDVMEVLTGFGFIGLRKAM